MNSSIFLLVFQLFVNNISCNADLLSKFHQNVYKVKDVRASLISYNKELANFFDTRSFKYNRTTVALNFTLNLKVDMLDKLEVLVQAYKFLSNEYRLFPHLRFQVNAKKSFDTNAMGVANVKCGNMTTFYLYKDITYHLCNFVVDETHLPPLLPTGRYKFDVTYLYLNEELGLENIFFEVDVPIV